jgi:hypothetical protein
MGTKIRGETPKAQLSELTTRRPTELLVWSASRQRGQCRSCGAAIEWSTLVDSAKHIPLDLPVVVKSTTQANDGRLIDHVESVTHFGTCPDAQQWRRKKESRP